MKSKYLHIKSFHSILLIIVALLMNLTLSFGQNDMTKLRDGSVSGNVDVSAAPFSILELESVTKGFLLPRMTTAERNTLTNKITDKVRGNGLAIYNTDNDCINYWSTAAKKWLSVCGTIPPAKITLDCAKVYLNASGDNELKQGQSLKETDVLYVTVSVVESGSYTISGVTNNGYSFSKAGVFETPGTYSMPLEGFGTPLQANEKPNGDAVVFKVNGKEVSCTDVKIPVKSSALSFNIVEPQAIALAWSAYKGVPLNAADNIIKVKVNVTTPGFWRVQSDKTDNGISLSGSGEFKEGDTGEQIITIYGQGTPIDVKDSTFKLETNSKDNKTSNVSVTVKVVPTAFELVCSEPTQIEVRGEYNEDAKLNKSHSVQLPIKVLAPGIMNIVLKATIKGVTDKVIEFRADNTVLSFNGGDNIQYVTLYPAKDILTNDDVVIPAKSTEVIFTELVSNSGTFCANFPKKDVVARSKNYSFDCAGALMMAGSSTTSENYFNVNTPFVSGQGLLVVINVGYAEKYKIRTNTVNGVYFEKSGQFTEQEKSSGRATVVLEPYGKFEAPGNFYFSLSTEGMETDLVNACSVVAQVRGRDINILSIGGSAYSPDPKRPDVSPYAIVGSSRNFGPNGKVKVNGINVVSYSHILRENLAGLISKHRADIIIIGYPARFDAGQKNDLVNFVKIQKGVLIVADESNFGGDETSIQLVRDLGNGGTPTASNRSDVFSLVNPVIGPVNDPIITTTEFGSISGGKLGNDVAANGWYFKGLPSDYIPLAVSEKDRNGVFAFRHNSLGFIFIGDGGAFAGRYNYYSNHIWPAVIAQDGTPLPHSKYTGGTVYNAIFYANSIKWAIDYVIKNKPLN
ncbi:hypothetical protein HX039_17595 [Myroides marinus]|uniref:hypothetical protein n=1 Tax=Myroides marinus TaxID=703342 RepID=UPI0025776AD9|nr:hypothetical protein [Myroides marinus]MDM1405890.1 hypothetical protein [Myroides marinus]